MFVFHVFIKKFDHYFLFCYLQVLIVLLFLSHRHCKGHMANFPAFTGGGRSQMLLAFNFYKEKIPV